MPKTPPINVIHADALTHPCEALLLPAYTDAALSATLHAINSRLMNSIQAQFGTSFNATVGEVMVLPTFGQTAALHVVVFGMGDRTAGHNHLRSALAAGLRKAYAWSADHMAVVLTAGSWPANSGLGAAVTGAVQDAADAVQQLDVLVPLAQDIATVQADL